MTTFELPYNFDDKLIDFLEIYNENPDFYDSIYCIFMPPWGHHYNSVPRSYSISKKMFDMTLEEYINHIKYVNRTFSEKKQLLLQRPNELMDKELLEFYINELGFTKFCVGSIAQAKMIKDINPNFDVIGSILMLTNKQKIEENFDEYKKYFSGFVLGFNYTKDIDAIMELPLDFNYILMCNTGCDVRCTGKDHWALDLFDERLKEYRCPYASTKSLRFASLIRPMDLYLFYPYITIFKITGRAFPTWKIIQNIVQYTSKYSIAHNQKDIELYKRKDKKENDGI